MQLLKKIHEDEFIIEFLKAENPENYINLNPISRKQLLAEKRGYGKNILLFKNFPDNLEWFDAYLYFDDFKKIETINQPFWNDNSNNTRLVSEVAKRIENKQKLTIKENEDKIHMIASQVELNHMYPKLILVSKNEESKVIVLEGHHRLIAYMLKRDIIREPIEIIIGFSPLLDKWTFY